jgi:hypothetical protein
MFSATHRSSSGAVTVIAAFGFTYVCGCRLLPATTNRPDHKQQHCYHHAPTVKPEATDVELLMMDVRMPKTC